MYFSVYGRYTNFDVDFPFDYTVNSRTYTVPLTNETKMIAGGAMIGHQFIIAKKIALDLYIVGAHFGNLKGDAVGLTNLSDLTTAQKQDLKNELEEKFVFNDKKYLTVDVTNQGVQAKINGPVIGIRSFGINVGFAF